MMLCYAILCVYFYIKNNLYILFINIKIKTKTKTKTKTNINPPSLSSVYAVVQIVFEYRQACPSP